MNLRVKAWEVPLRLGAGAFILNSGLAKLGKEDATTAQTHAFAAGAYPVLHKLDPQLFVRALSVGEIALGAALLVPAVPAVFAGAGLTAFSASLLGLYVRTPGLRQEGSLRPTDQGVPIAKDVWLLAIGISFLLEDLSDRMRRTT
ncbi:MAG: hypothetical protein JWO11_2620 [Nocardioides sp.]|nr:hypothetical protein [Nocardioides sp.]